jgi:putative component of toxin-antitoxin plasmid stabilization module
MIEVRQTDIFSAWFENLRDIRARAQIIRRIERAKPETSATSRPSEKA